MNGISSSYLPVCCPKIWLWDINPRGGAIAGENSPSH